MLLAQWSQGIPTMDQQDMAMMREIRQSESTPNHTVYLDTSFGTPEQASLYDEQAHAHHLSGRQTFL